MIKMAKSLYIAAMEPKSGKSVVALGLMELLSRRVRKVGFFRPVIASSDRRDKELHLILTRYNLAHTYEVADARSPTSSIRSPSRPSRPSR
jgi:phosphate acetyltransferase